MKRFALLAITFGAGCAAGPTTGQTYNGSTSGAVLGFFGYTDTKQATIKAYALTDPYGELDGPFTFIGSTTSASTATGGMNDPNKPAYYWSLSSNPISANQWRPGGLLRLKTRSKWNGATTESDMASFDDGGPACAYEEILDGEKWWAAGAHCKSPYPNDTIITMASTTPTPTEEHFGDIRFLAYRGGVYPSKCDPEVKPVDTVAAATKYYETIGAPATLTLFKQKYGFGEVGTNQVRAVFYNAGDLGIGRDMNCKTKAMPGGGVATACYVSNYGRNPVVPHRPAGFGDSGVDPQTAINQALAPQGPPDNQSPNAPVATVAMVHDTSLPVDQRVQFMVYDDNGVRTELAPLDNAGLAAGEGLAPVAANLTVPNNCLTCHGPSSAYTPSAAGGEVVHGAHFLPFDPDAYVFSTQHAAYSKANMLPQLKKLNAFVWDTGKTPAITEMLRGMYPSASNTGPKDAASVFDPSFIPTGFTNVAPADVRIAKNVYTKVVKPYCRTCHVADADMDWNTYQEVKDAATFIGYMVCNQNSTVPMPQAEQVQTRMWHTGARAHLMAAFGLIGACTLVEPHPDDEACP